MQLDFMKQPLSNNYVIPSIAGRLGNNLFMIANAYARAMDGNRELYLCRKDLNYNDNYTENILSKFNYIDEFPNSRNINPVNLSDTEPNIFSGYFQSERYFEKYSSDIKSLFGPTEEFVNRMRVEIPILFSNNVTAIHIRRGDYLNLSNYHPTVSAEYITEAIKHVPNEYYLIASDDIPWCKENIHLENTIYSEGYSSHEQLWILSLCKDFVIANSSFSWWGAYLSLNENKIVVAPETWFGPDGWDQWSEIYCKDWKILPTYFDNGLIKPK